MGVMQDIIDDVVDVIPVSDGLVPALGAVLVFKLAGFIA
jgi:hypothetical protein